MNKKEIRDKAKKERARLQPEQVQASSKSIIHNLTQHQLWKSSLDILFYASFNNEVHTHDLIRESLKTKNVFLPKTQNGELKIFEITTWTDLARGNYNILEPHSSSCTERHQKAFDLILVPGLAFDKQGHRIGYGKGYYDKFLATTQGATAGLAYDRQLCDELPTDTFDIALEYIFTETEIIKL